MKMSFSLLQKENPLVPHTPHTPHTPQNPCHFPGTFGRPLISYALKQSWRVGVSIEKKTAKKDSNKKARSWTSHASGHF